jgi:uncharacterized membrane protein
MTYMRGRPSVWVLTGIILLAQGFFSRPAFTQGEPQPPPAQETPSQPQVLRNPEVNYAVHSDISPPLSLMARVVSPQQGSYLAPEVRYPKLQLLTNAAQRGLGPLADGALQTSSGPLVSATPGLDLLGVGNGFPNYTIPDAPTDVNLAVGDTQVVQWVNVSYAVFNKTTGAVIAGPILGNQFWAGFGRECETYNSGDIIAQWDKIAHRWVMTQNVFSAPYFTCVAISQTADATGPYYRFQFPQSGFPDYPKWGIWPDAYYQSQNNFGSTGNAYVGATACAYERAKLLVGDSTAKQICFTTGTFDDSLLPGDLDSAGTLPPTGQAEVYLGSIDSTPPNGSVIYKYLFHVDFTTPSNSTFTGDGETMPISVASFGLACGGVPGGCIPQRGVADQLASLGDRLMYRLAYRNFSDHQTWLVSHSVTAGSSVGERWYEFRAPENSTSLSVFQQGTFAPDSNYRWMGSIAMDSAQDIALGYSISSPSMYPSISYTGRVPSDALGTMESEAQIVAGTGSQTFTVHRWGDYTSMAIDGADDCTFWYTNQYYMVTAQFDWSTRLASFKFPSCGTTTPDFSLSASPPSQSVVQGQGTTYTVTVSPLSGFSGTVNLTASGLPSGASASFNPASVSGSGSSTMAATTSTSTPAGTYTITITGSSGSVTHTTTVSLTVNAAAQPNFSLSRSPSSVTIVQGGSAGTSTITITPSNGFASSVALSATGVPSGVTAAFSPNPATSTSTLTLTASSTATTGTATVTVTGTSSGLTHTTTVTLTVNAAATPNFSLSASPSSVTIVQGGSAGTSTITITPSNGFSGSVSLSATGVPNGVTAAFGTNPATSSSTLTLTASGTATTGTATVTVTGTSSGLTHTTTVTLTVNAAATPNFSLSASPSSVTIVQGGSAGTSTIAITPSNGFSGSVTLSATGVPNGVTAAFGTNPATSSSILTLTASGTATTGAATVTVTGTSGSLTHTTTVSLTVNAAAQPNYTLSASPSSLSVARGSTGTSTITIHPTNGFTGSVTFSGSSLPTGVTASFSPNPSTSSSTLTLTVGGSASTGTFSVRVRGRSGGLSHSVRISLTVN